jgi:putative IMPACT (imprinted ancient) family translation regulator
MALPKIDLNDLTAKKIIEHSRFIATHGNHEQIRMLITAIKKHSTKNSHLFLKLLTFFTENTNSSQTLVC